MSGVERVRVKRSGARRGSVAVGRAARGRGCMGGGLYSVYCMASSGAPTACVGALPPRPLRLYRPARVARRRARYTHTHEVAEWRVYRSSVTLYRTYVRPALSEEFTLGYPPHVL